MTAIPAPAPNRATTPRPKQPPATPDSDAPLGRKPNNHRSGPADPLSDRATENLIRRTLCPQQSLSGDKEPPSIEDLLPPLSSRNDVDLQLYAFLAIILREFVQSWYSKITTDETFVQEVLHVIAHCSGALEQRFRKIDTHSLLLDEIPDLLDRHVAAYRASHQPGVQAPIEINSHDIYHALTPLPALSPVPHSSDPATTELQLQNEALYRQLLVQGVLSILLPTEDLENPCLTALVEQIFSELIIGNVIVNKAAQPWLLFEAICIVARVLQQKKSKREEDELFSATGTSRGGWSVHGVFLSVISWAVLVISFARGCFATVIASSSLPSRKGYISISADSSHPASYDALKSYPAANTARDPVPVLEYRLWACLGNVTELGLRMPWLSGMLSLLKHGAVHGPWHTAGVDGPLDRILTYHIATLLDPVHLPSLLRTLRGVLFPNNAPGTPSLFPPTSDEALLALRRRAASAVWGLLPRGVGRLYFGGRLWRHAAAAPRAGAGSADQEGEDEEMVDEVEGLLMVLSDEYCNKHLMYGVLELVLVRLIPELAEKGIVDLMEERLG